MDRNAEKYAITFDELECIHLGQLPFLFQKDRDEKKAAVLLNRERKAHLAAFNM